MIPAEALHRLVRGLVAHYYESPSVREADEANDLRLVDRRVVSLMASSHNLDGEDLATAARVVSGEGAEVVDRRDPTFLALRALERVEEMLADGFAGAIQRESSEADIAAAVTFRIAQDVIEHVRRVVLPTL